MTVFVPFPSFLLLFVFKCLLPFFSLGQSAKGEQANMQASGQASTSRSSSSRCSSSSTLRALNQSWIQMRIGGLGGWGVITFVLS